MEDAVVLAECLGAASRDGTDVQAALLEYEARRRPRTTKVQNNVLSLREFWFATDPEQRMGGMRRMQAQDRMDPMAESQWEWIYSYDASLEAHAPGEYTLAMPASRTGRETVWPRKNADQRWSGIFADFDGLAVGNAGMRAAYESYFAAAVPAERSVQGGVECAVTGSVQADGPVIVHMHGGGYVLGSVAASMLYANALAKASGAAVVSVGYRRAPEHPFPAPVEDLLAVYRDLTASGVAPERIYFSGESSGAAIALSALMRLRDDGAELPRALVAVSPFADLTLSGESGAANGFGDEFINKDQLTYLATSYFQQHDPASAGVSPVFGDFAGLPPLLVFAARHEALASDAVRIVLNAEKAGTSARLVLAESTTHAFALFAGEPAAQAAIDLAGEFIRSLWEEPDVTLSDFMRRNLSLLQDIS